MKILLTILLSGAVCLFTAVTISVGLLTGLELQGYDLLVASQDVDSPPDKVVVVDFDDATVESFNAFPIPRALLAEVVEKVAAGEPELIGLDVLLDKGRDPADDEKLIKALESAGNVILADVFPTEQLPGSEPLVQFHEQALDVAFVNTPMDSDGFVRRQFLWARTSDYEGFSFPVVLASNYLQIPPKPGRPGFFRLGDKEIPLDGESPNAFLIGSWGSAPVRSVSVERLLSPEFDPQLFNGKIVLVGQSSTAAKDLYPTPVFRFRQPVAGRAMLSGTEIHAAAITSLLSGKAISLPSDTTLWTMNFLLVLLAISLLVTTRPLYSILAVFVGMIGVYAVAQLLFSNQQIWIKFVSAEVNLLLALPAGLGYRFLEERRLKARAEAHRQELMGLFERYVSPEVAAEIWQRRDEIVLAGEEKAATVLFSDIRSFTASTTGKPSAQVLAWLNEYFNAMNEVIKQNGGFLNKFIGDGLLVIFGVPLGHGVQQDACGAVRAAVQMIERVEKLNAEKRPNWIHIQIGVGLHSGTLTAGNVGARDRLEYSVIGETVNLASRLEAMTKNFKTSIVMSPQTQELVQDQFQTRPLGKVKVRGFPEDIEVYTVST